MENLNQYPDFKEKLEKQIEAQGSATLGFNAALALASLLHDKGVIKFEEFVDEFYSSLAKEEEE